MPDDEIWTGSGGDNETTDHATRGTDVSSPALPMRIASNPLESTATLRPGSTFARSATTQSGGDSGHLHAHRRKPPQSHHEKTELLQLQRANALRHPQSSGRALAVASLLLLSL